MRSNGKDCRIQAQRFTCIRTPSNRIVNCPRFARSSGQDGETWLKPNGQEVIEKVPRGSDVFAPESAIHSLAAISRTRPLRLAE